LGAIIMSATVVDDLVSWTLLFVVFEQTASAAAGSVTATSAEILGPNLAMVALLFVAVLAVGWFTAGVIARLRRRKSENIAERIGLLSVLILLTAAAAEHLGIHAFLGPFLLGIALTPNEEDAGDESYTAIRNFSHGFFVLIYFVSLGLTTDFVAHFVPPLVGAVLAVACVSKIPAAYLGARLGGVERRAAWAIGCGMNARGATGIILANLGLVNGVIDQPIYVALVLMAIVTSLAAGPSMKLLLRTP
jgi:Kef-type K+ transport system membrane component KefB